MSHIALFHSVLGVRPGIEDAATRLREAGHETTVVDYYGGASFDAYDGAGAFVEGVGFPTLMQRALDGVADLPDGFLVAGFSNGGGMAEHVALHRNVGGAVLISGTLPLEMLGATAWPAGLPVQIHATLGDPLRRQDWTDALVGAVRAAGAPLEQYDYPGAGHLFTDPSLPDEYDPVATGQLWTRVLAFSETTDAGSAA